MFGIILGSLISILLIFLIIKEAKLKTDGDLFMGCVIPILAGVSALVDFIDNKFNLKNASTYIYIIVCLLSIAYIIVFFIKYQAYLKEHPKKGDPEDEE